MPQNKIKNPFSSISNKDPNFLKSDLFQFGMDEGIPRNQNVIQNAGMILQDSRTPKTELSPIGLPDLPEPESETESIPQDDNQSRFLASLLGQGAAMFGGAIAGRDPMKIAEQFSGERLLQDRMAQAREQEQYTRGERELLKQEQNRIRIANEEQRKLAIEQAKNLMNPDSEESKRKRLVYERALGIKIPSEFSASDLEDRNVLQGLIAQSQPKTVLGRGGGLAQLKPEKEIKSNQKSMAEYRDHVASLSEMGNVLNNIKLLNRTAIGTITPDFATNTQAYSSSLDRAAQPMIKTLAGPGTLQKEERDTYGKLVPTGNTRADLALRQANDIIIEGTNKSLSKMNTDLSTGDISKKDYDALINEYNEQLTKKGIGINQVINPSTGRLEPREKKEATLKNGKKVLIDQFGYTWE